MQGASGIALYCLNKPDRFAKEYLNRFVWELYKRICSNKLDGSDDFSIPTGLAGLWCVLQKLENRYFRIEYLSYIIDYLTDIFIQHKTVELTAKKGIIPGWNQSEVGLLWTRFQISQTKSQALEQWEDYGKLYLDNDDCFEAGLYGGNFSLANYQFTKMVIGCMIVGIGFGVPTVVYRRDDLPMPVRVLVHMGIGCIVYTIVAYAVGWMGGAGTVIQGMIMAALQFALAFVIWALFMCYYRKEARKMNEQIQKMTGNGLDEHR